MKALSDSLLLLLRSVFFSLLHKIVKDRLLCCSCFRKPVFYCFDCISQTVVFSVSTAL